MYTDTFPTRVRLQVLLLLVGWISASAAYAADAGPPALWQILGSCSRVPGDGVPLCWRIRIRSGLSPAISSESVALNLPDLDAPLVAYREQKAGAKPRMWTGTIAGDQKANVTLSVVDNALSGLVVTPQGRIFQLRENPEDGPVIERLVPNRAPPELPPVVAPTRPLVVSKRPPCLPATTPVIDMLVIYTPAAVKLAGGEPEMRSRIDIAEATVNAALANSGVNARLEVVASRLTQHVESNIQADLGRLRCSNDGYMDEVHGWRDAVGADLVVLVTSHQTGGQAYLLAAEHLSNQSFAASAFAVVPDFVLTWPYLFAHEVGHLFGADHDPASSEGREGVFPYNHGYIDPDAAVTSGCSAWMTVMSYGTYCGDCVPRPYWSNTTKNLPGCNRPMGVSTLSDNARTINETAATVAAFRCR